MHKRISLCCRQTVGERLKFLILRMGEKMVYFTADLHFYHKNIIKNTNRPFQDADEMNRILIQKWNERVNFNDDVYILGDVTMRGPEMAAAVLYALKGKKHLVRGNHDGFADRDNFDVSLFASIQNYAEIVVDNTKFILFHYPLLEWNQAYKGSIMLHGHQHNHADYNIENRRKGILRYDVGVDANAMSPVSAREIILFFEGTVNYFQSRR